MVLLIHGLMAGIIPAVLVFLSPEHTAGLDAAFFRGLGLIGSIAGIAVYGRTTLDLTVPSGGTPAIWDPPRDLIHRGPYQIIRNPMYAAVCLTVLGEAVVLNQTLLIAYSAVLWIGFHCFVCFYEEPVLRRTFGKAYEDYCRTVPRWLPSFFTRPKS